ncbi:MAG: 4Fe-4S dicluster domain-containing protein, partial [Desulfurivibrionaceae bacterium]|nr:4Fe-4S dicluster domain-containing protein [Desulfurivibrionaceae bacterium]
MIFKVLAAGELEKFFELLVVNKLIGPVERGPAVDGRLLFDFAEVAEIAELRLDFTQTVHSAKKYLLPYLEETGVFVMEGSDWEKRVDYGAHQPLVLFGLHACDINALNKLDKVLLAEPYPNRFYGAKRAAMFIIGHSCRPTPACFCRSMGADSVRHGCDLFLTPLGDDYFVEIMSSRAFHIMESLDLREPTRRDHKRFQEQAKHRGNLLTAEVDATDLTKILDMEFDSTVWNEWGRRCLSCGTCAQVCPTCYCYGVEEVVALDLAKGAKIRQLYSCNLLDFAEVAGGYNFRPESRTRLKYRYYHKHRGFVEAFEEPLC